MSHMIEVRDLVKKFGEFCAVDHISFGVPKGSIFGFLGPNGAGKTTTIKILTTILKPDGGVIHVNGHDPVREEREVRRSFGIVFQDPSLDGDLTALENLELHAVLYGVPSKERAPRIEEVIKLVELWDRRQEFTKNYSGGMKRRLEIARALLHVPPVLFLDEPTLGLDPQTRNHIWNYIRALRDERKITVFFTTHYMEEAERVADEIAVIDRGKIVTQGTPAELKLKTQTQSLEDAFIALTGHAIRDEEASSIDQIRAFGKMWGRR